MISAVHLLEWRNFQPAKNAAAAEILTKYQTRWHQTNCSTLAVASPVGSPAKQLKLGTVIG